MPSVSQTVNGNVLASLQTSLTGDNVDELHSFLSPDSHLDISAFWTRANQGNDSVSATAACKAISQLIVKIDGEKGFSSPGAAFIRRVLVEHSKSVFRNLSSARPMYVNPTLRLLLTMSQFDAGSLANEVYVSMDFGTFKALPKLLIRSGPQTQKPQEEKVTLGKRKREDGHTKDATRGLFIALLFTFLNHSQSTSKAEILQRRPIVTELFKHLPYDSETSVQKTLKGLVAILDSRDIPRPVKVQFFNEWTLSQLSALYRREETLDDGETTLRSHVQSFFMKATTIPDQGICFASTGLVPPANKKLYNPILAAFITTLQPMTDDLQYDLLLSILTATPELIAHWLHHATLDLTPRLDVDWIKAMGLIERILSIPLPSATISQLHLIPEYVITENICPTLLAKILTKGLQHESDLVKLMSGRTLHQSLDKARTLLNGEEQSAQILDNVQRRVPLVEILTPLASKKVDPELGEEVLLLREEIISVLAAYLDIFDDVPSFDFVGLFNLIMTATPRDGSSGAENSDLDNLGTSSRKEKTLVIGMADKIDNVQWLSKRKGSNSIFSIMMHHIHSSLQIDDDTAGQSVNVLGSIIKNDSIMFSTETRLQAAPVPKLEALVRALPTSPDPTIVSEVIRFIEESMIRFQASPYKYWDALVDICVQGGRTEDVDISAILLTFSEQLSFAKDKEYIRVWFKQVVSLLVHVGEDRTICEHILGSAVQDAVLDTVPCLWNAIEIVQTTMEDFESGHPSWRALREMVPLLEGSAKMQVKKYAVAQWILRESFVQSHCLNILETAVECFDRQDFTHSEDCQSLLFRALLASPESAHNQFPTLSPILSPEVALTFLERLVDHDTPTSPFVIASLIDCVQGSEVILKERLLSKLHNRCDLRSTAMLRALSRAMRRSVIENFDLANFMFKDGLPNSPNIATAAVAECIATYLSQFPTARVSGAFIKWSETASFIDASVVIIPLLNSQAQESHEVAKRLLDSHTVSILTDSDDLISTTSASRKDVLRCLEIKIEADPNFREQFNAEVFERLESVDCTDLLQVQLLTVISRHHLDDTPEDSKDSVKKYHRKMISSLTRRFAEDRIQESKILSSEILDFLESAAVYVRMTSSFSTDCGQALLNPLVEAALENQSHHLNVTSFILAVAETSSIEAFNYARTIQKILANKLALSDQDIRFTLVKLLSCMISHDPAQSNLNVMDEMLKLYRGTVDSTDVLIFEILGTIETAVNVSLGTRIKSWRLVETVEDDNERNSIDAVLSSEIALNTILNYVEHDTAVDNDTPTPVTYDLRFALPLIAGYLRSDSSIAIMKQLIEHHALGLVFLGLSSRHLSLRQSSSYLLSKFFKLILSSTIREKAQLETLFGLVRDSLTTQDLEKSGIPRIQAVFLALTCNIMMNPAHYLYEKINRFLLARPQLDFTDIPLFLNLFNSHDNYAKDVNWLLRLLAAGIVVVGDKHDHDDDDDSHLLYRRRHVLEMCMGLYRSQSATEKVKEGIRCILQKVALNNNMKRYFERVGGLTWLHMGSEQELVDIQLAFHI